MATRTSTLKLTVADKVATYNEGLDGEVWEEHVEAFYQLTIYNFSSTDELITEYGIYSKDGKSKKVLSHLPYNRVQSAVEILYPLRHGEEHEFSLSVPRNDKKSFTVPFGLAGSGRAYFFYIKTKNGTFARATKQDNKLVVRMALIKLSKRINPWHKALPETVIVLFLAVLISLLAFVGVITHDRSTYSAIGSIAVSPANAPSKYYTLKVGSLDEAAKNGGVTDTIFVSNSATHWYSIPNHKVYGISAATWPNGGRLTFQDAGCTIPNKKVRAYCVADDGKAYYVGIVTVEPNIVDQLNAPQAQ